MGKKVLSPESKVLSLVVGFAVLAWAVLARDPVPGRAVMETGTNVISGVKFWLNGMWIGTNVQITVNSSTQLVSVVNGVTNLLGSGSGSISNLTVDGGLLTGGGTGATVNVSLSTNTIWNIGDARWLTINSTATVAQTALAGWPTQWSYTSITNAPWLTSVDWTANPSNSVLQGSINGKADTGTVVTVTGLGSSGTVTVGNGGTIALGNAILTISTNGAPVVVLTNTGTLNFIAGSGLTRTVSNAGGGQANLTMSLDDAGYDAYGRSLSALRLVPFSDMGSATVSGSVTRNAGKLDLRVNGNAPSNASSQVTINYFNTEVGSGAPSRGLPMSWELAGNMSVNGTAGLWFGLGYFDQSTGLLTNTGIGVYVQTNGVLVSQVHNGSTFNSVTNGTFANASYHSRLICNYRGGVFNVYLTRALNTIEMPAPSLVASITNTLPSVLANASPYNLTIGCFSIATNTSAFAESTILQYLRVSEWR